MHPFHVPKKQKTPRIPLISRIKIFLKPVKCVAFLHFFIYELNWLLRIWFAPAYAMILADEASS